MASVRPGGLAGDLEALFSEGSLSALSDGPLLDRFLSGGGRGEAAFEALVNRHGPMVLRVCRGVLDPHDAHDAFQATFLVLVRRAGSIRKRGSVASWLFGVAGRVSARARADAARRRKHEARGAAMSPGVSHDRPPHDPDLARVVHEEVARLPARYRSAVVLCDLEGRALAEAAEALGCPLGTLKTRLSRGRDRLRDRLTRRGLAAPAGLVGVGLLGRQASAAVPPTLARATARAASAYGSGRSAAVAAGVVSAHVVSLAEGMTSTMLATKLLIVAAGALALGLSAAGAVLVATSANAARSAADRQPGPAVAPATIALTPANAERLALDAVLSQRDPRERTRNLVALGGAQARRGEALAARKTLRLAKEAAEAVPLNDPDSQPHVMIYVAEAQAKAGDSDEAHRTFERAVDIIATEDMDHQIQSWINLHPIEVKIEGRSACRKMIEAYRCWAERCIKTGEWGGESNKTTLLALQAEAGDFLGALKGAREAPDFDGPGVVTFRKEALVKIASALRPGDEAVADTILKEARNAVDTFDVNDQIACRSQDLASLATTLSRLGRFTEAVATARAIVAEGAHPKTAAQAARCRTEAFHATSALVAIANDQLETGDKDGARATARLAIEVVGSPGGLRFVSFGLAAALSALARAGDPEEAQRLARTSLARATDDRNFEALEWAGSTLGDEAGARAFSELARKNGEEWLRRLKRDPARAGGRKGLDGRSIGELARIQARLGDLPAALLSAGTIANPEERQIALGRVAGGLAAAGRLSEAQKVIDMIESPEYRVYAWVDVACALPAPKPAPAAP